MLSSEASRAETATGTATGLPPLGGSPPRSTLLAECAASDGAESSASAVYLSPSGTFLGGQSRADYDMRQRPGNLAIAIRQRIESRIGGRVRDLAVRVSGNTIVLEGRCSTYYSKQLAQHAVLGVIEDENLENDIVVSGPK